MLSQHAVPACAGHPGRPPCLLSVRTFSTGFQGRAERAEPGPAPYMQRAPSDGDADCGAALRPPGAGWPPRGRRRARRRLPSFDPSGRVGADAHSTPRPTARGNAPQRQRWRAGCKRRHPSGACILKPCVLAVKIARCARVAARSLRASGPLRRRDSGAPIGGMARNEHWRQPGASCSKLHVQVERSQPWDSCLMNSAD
jgi:hypothetical protein